MKSEPAKPIKTEEQEQPDPGFLKFLGRVQALPEDAKANLRALILKELGLEKTPAAPLPVPLQPQPKE
jgi:hypothetical protein